MKVLDIPAGPQLYLISMSVLAISYFFASVFLFSVTENGTKQNNVLFSIASGLTLSILVLGILFKVFSWSFCMSLLYLGIISVFLMLILGCILKDKSPLKSYYSTIIVRSIILLGLGLLVLLLPVKNYHYKENGELIEMPDKSPR
jgi:hypothetical protein